MSRRAAFGARLTGDDSPAPAPPAANSNSPARPRAQSNAGARGARGGANKGKGRADQGRNQQQQSNRSTAAQQPHQAAAASSGTEDRRAQMLAVNARAAAMAKAADEAGETDQDGEICFICAEGPVQYWSVGECNHRTCHTCSIRLRALYKKNECTFCKTECPTVVFTGSDDKPFEDFKPEDTPFSDTKLGVLFETRAQLDDTLSLLRFNCPYKPGLSDPGSAAPDDPAEACQHILAGWSDLKRHVRSSHHCTLCDLCCSNKKIFTHEHELFAMSNPNANGGGGGHHQQQGRRKGTELDHHLEKEHSMCGFCKRWFYDSDGLYKHCREQHEECFICTKQGIRHQYHLNYDRLEQHFKSDHYLCPHPDCLAQKFVVFESELDLQAHALEVHGVGSSVDQKARKEARRIETSFTYSTGETSRGANEGGAGRRRAGGGGGRAPVASFVEPAREDPVQTPRGERRVPGLGAIQALGSGAAAGGSGGGNSRAARFGGQLTPDPASTPLSRSGATTPTSTVGAAESHHDAATLERHAALMRRVQDAANGNEGKVAGFKFAVRSYRAGELGARDVCDQLYNIFDQRTDEAGAIVLAFADLLEDEDKKRGLRNAWREMSSENQFPSLIALAPTLNGVPTQVNNTSQRALSAQHRSGVNPSSTWARVEQAAHSSGPAPVAPRSNPFPALMATSNAREIPGLSKAGLQKKRNVGGGTAWSSAASAGTRPSPSTSGTRHSAGSAFPTLGAVASASSSSSAPISRVGSVVPPSSSVNRPASAFAGSSRGAVSIPRAPNGLEFPSLPASNSEADRRARMRAALAKPAGRTVIDDGEADGGIWNGTGSVGGEAGGSSLGANGGGKKKGKGRQKVVLMSGGLASQPQ